MKNQFRLIFKISIFFLFLIISSMGAKAQSRDTTRVKDRLKFNVDSLIYAIDGVIVSKSSFENLKEKKMGLVTYPGTIFDLSRTRTVVMKVTEKNAESEAVLKLRAKAKELGLRTLVDTRNN